MVSCFFPELIALALRQRQADETREGNAADPPQKLQDFGPPVFWRGAAHFGRKCPFDWRDVPGLFVREGDPARRISAAQGCPRSFQATMTGFFRAHAQG